VHRIHENVVQNFQLFLVQTSDNPIDNEAGNELNKACTQKPKDTKHALTNTDRKA